ncbi:MAG: serine protease [Bacteroidales bacterium]|nr:serine protease [Bacteroidales bacterium]
MKIKTIIVCMICTLSGIIAQGQVSSGTGFLVSRNGLLATCYHVIQDAETILVTGINQDFFTYYRAEVAAIDRANDLAILQIRDPLFVPFSTPVPYVIKPTTANVGDECFTVGFPRIMRGMGTEPKLTNGIISSRTGARNLITRYQMTTPIQSGNSGGPLFDRSGNVIGVVSNKNTLAEVENVAYAVKSNYLMNLIETLPSDAYQNPMSASRNMQSQYSQIRNYVCAIFSISSRTITSQTSRAIVDNVWVEHFKSDGVQMGMEIYVDFQISGMMNKQGACVAWFYYDNGKKPMIAAHDGAYNMPDKQVAAIRSFVPNSDLSQFSDFVLFIPYSAFPRLGNETYNLAFRIGILDSNSDVAAVSSLTSFSVPW